MKKHMLIFMIAFLSITQSFALDRSKDANQLFYEANTFYEKGEYAKAIESYIDILNMGLESSNLYYNIGNGFLKLGKIGYAILCYEKARRFGPGDSDLRSNLNYAKSFVEDSSTQALSSNLIIRIIERPFKDFNLNAIAISGAIFYMIVICLASISIVRPTLARKSKIILLVIFVMLLWNILAFAIRYYDEVISKHGIVIQQEAECKYEPIDKSTTYYRLHEGNQVLILETRSDWRRIKRFDGKVAWVKKEAVEGI